MNKLQRLTWKYFISQKIDEVLKPVFYIGFWGLISVLPLYALSYFGRFVDELFLSYGMSKELALESMTSISDHAFYSLLGTLSLISIAIILFLTGMILFIFYQLIIVSFIDWLQSNWKRAKERAKLEVKRK